MNSSYNANDKYEKSPKSRKKQSLSPKKLFRKLDEDDDNNDDTININDYKVNFFEEYQAPINKNSNKLKLNFNDLKSSKEQQQAITDMQLNNSNFSLSVTSFNNNNKNEKNIFVNSTNSPHKPILKKQTSETPKLFESDINMYKNNSKQTPNIFRQNDEVISDKLNDRIHNINSPKQPHNNKYYKHLNVINENQNHSEDLYPIIKGKVFDKKCKGCEAGKQEIFKIRKDFLNIKDDNRRLKLLVEERNTEILNLKRELEEKVKVCERDSEYIKKQDLEINRLDYLLSKIEDDIKIKEEEFIRERNRLNIELNNKVNEIKMSFIEKDRNIKGSTLTGNTNYYSRPDNNRNVLNSNSNNRIKNLTINNKFIIKTKSERAKSNNTNCNLNNINNNCNNLQRNENDSNKQLQTSTNSNNNKNNYDSNNNQKNNNSINNNTKPISKQIILDYAGKETFDFKTTVNNNVNNFFENKTTSGEEYYEDNYN